MGNSLVERIYRHLPMPHFIWVCELADPDEYCREGKILGEIIWDPTRNVHETDGWIAVHCQEWIWIDQGAAFNQSADRVVGWDRAGGPNWAKKFPLQNSTSYLLLASNLNTL
jgi:hypothetical protein